jgi:hypothetical protein
MSVAVSRSGPVRRQSGYLRLGGAGWALLAPAFMVVAALSTEPTLTFGSLVVLVAGAQLLWRPGEPPILFAAFFIQWLQISLSLFRASFYGVELHELLASSDGIIAATWLSLFGLMALAIGIRVMLRGVGPGAWATLISEIQQYSLKKAFIAYWIAQVVFFELETVTWSYPGLAQPLLALSNLRWVFFFVVATIVFVKQRGYPLLAILFLFEMVRGFLSFFSDFTQVFLIAALAFITARPKINAKTIAVTSVIFAGVLVLSAAWSVVKLGYRDFLNGGTNTQSVLVGPLERLDRISDLMLNRGLTQLPKGFDLLARRIEYTYYFGRVVDRVPRLLPYDDGALWGDAVLRVFTPRLLFPDKSPLAAEVLTTQHYTGLNLSWATDDNTEIPLGYMAESYIDFGPVVMFVPIFLLGLLVGAQYRYLITRPRYLLFVYGAAPVIFMPVAQFGWSAAKILGGNITSFAALYVTLLLVVSTIHRWLLISPESVASRDSLPIATRATRAGTPANSSLFEREQT